MRMHVSNNLNEVEARVEDDRVTILPFKCIIVFRSAYNRPSTWIYLVVSCLKIKAGNSEYFS